MNQASRTISQCCDVNSIRRGVTWIPIEDESFTQVIVTLGRECHEWTNEAVNLEIDSLIEENNLSNHLIVYTDGSVQRGVRSGWGYTATLLGEVVKEDSGFVPLTTSSMCMEMQAITEMFKWVQHQAITRLVCLTDSMSTLAKVQNGLLHADWVEAIKHSNLQCVRWIFCPGHAGVRGNERADALAREARNESTLTLDPPTVLALVSEHLELTRVDTSHTTSLLKEKGFPRGAGRKCDLRGPARCISNQLLVGTVSPATLKWSLQRRAELLWQCPQCSDADSSPK